MRRVIEKSESPEVRKGKERERQGQGLGGMGRDSRDQGEEGQKCCNSTGKVVALSSLPGLGVGGCCRGEEQQDTEL